MEDLFAGYRQFRETYYRENEKLLKDLFNRGQAPKAMLVACADSRIEPALQLGAKPGDMFVVRNVANLVPPYQPDEDFHGTSAALEFAVKALKVEHIIVLGHARCGGVQALLSGPVAGQTDFVNAWMRIAEPARKAVEAAKPPDEDQRRLLAEIESIKVSLNNLRTFPWVKAAEEAGRLTIHGWYFNVGTGLLWKQDETGVFVPVT
jgi:carbonic anhydrase